VPTVDDELRDLLERAAREPATTRGVLDVVHAKYRSRVARRRARGAVSALAAVLAVAVTVMWAAGADGTDPRITPAHARRGPAVRVLDSGPATITADAGKRVAPRPVTLQPDRGYVRAPLIASGEFAAVTAYDRTSTGFTFPPSRVVRIDRRGRLLDEVELQGEVRALADGEGARWALTRDAVVTGPDDPEFRVKRIGPAGDVTSAAVPPGERPVGAIVAGGGGVWVPVAGGVLRFDPASGAYAGRIALPPANRRSVLALGKGVSATTDTGVARLDPSGMTALPETPLGTGRVIGAAQVRNSWVLMSDGARSFLVMVSPSGSPSGVSVALPRGVEATQIGASGGRLWVGGTFSGRRVVVVLRETGRTGRAVVEHVALVDADDVAVVAGDTMLATTDGRLWSIRLTGEQPRSNGIGGHR